MHYSPFSLAVLAIPQVRLAHHSGLGKPASLLLPFLDCLKVALHNGDGLGAVKGWLNVEHTMKESTKHDRKWRRSAYEVWQPFCAASSQGCGNVNAAWWTERAISNTLFVFIFLGSTKAEM